MRNHTGLHLIRTEKEFRDESLTYCYDGTLEGWFCCVYESYICREVPGVVVAEPDRVTSGETWLFNVKRIETRRDIAERVKKGIRERIGEDFLQALKRVFCSCMTAKELTMLLFTRKGFRYGMRIMNLRQDPVVSQVRKGLRDLGRETDKWLGFVRFTDVRGILIAVIGAKNHVLPFISYHFCDRFHNEHFMIYDKNHKMALVYRPGESAIIPMENFTIAEADEEEEQYRRLWKQFYDTIEIGARHNDACRRTHMPKRYWDFLTEMAVRKDIANITGKS